MSVTSDVENSKN